MIPRASTRLLAVPAALLVAVSGMRPAAGGLVEDWNAEAVAAIRIETQPPALAARNLAILHLAIFHAVEGAADDISREAAALAAAHEICIRQFPARKADFDRRFAKARDAIDEGEPRRTGFRIGRGVAQGILEARAADGSTTSVHYVPREAPSQWRRVTANRPPELPQWPKVRPFVLESGDQFRPPAPPALDSAEYAASLEEVRRLGAKQGASRTPDEEEAAVFWSDFSYTSTPPGHWNEIARSAAASQGLDLEGSSRLFALLNLALADAGIVAFDCKYHYNFWRPVSAIRRADEDRNGATTADPAWDSLLPSPPHPEYVSAHSAFSGAASQVLIAFFGRDDIRFEVGSDARPGVLRRYDSFSACAEEISRSRVFGGIHFPFSCDRGLAVGRAVARHVIEAVAAAAPEPGR